ncbi:hypothetical protein L0U85_00480 [Glycomyces sp. L485]|uniref:hypothetical protein n=1 Tax=Glycomyces sp. L485 TaxID=2909235 RepID=UPI001F4AB8E7|nr:hypothetical protein [Glycomyces sp. L485]MCH7229344.1 hypothetical protein [Glycomyces sp. L485]
MLQIPMYRTVAQTSLASGTGLRERFEDAFESDPSIVATGRTAAWIHGFDILPPGSEESDWPLECASDLPAPDTTVVDGLPVTCRARTLVDCAAGLPRLEAVAAADQFLRAGVDTRSLTAVLERLRGDRLRRANATLLAADPRAESPMESWTRCLIGDAGLPAPEPHLRVGTPGGRSAVLGLGWEEWKVGVEHEDTATRVDFAADTGDRRRHQALRGLGWEVLVLTGSDVMEHPRGWLVGLREALLERGWAPDLSVLHDIGARIDAVVDAMGVE